jgi:hypothetical protein
VAFSFQFPILSDKLSHSLRIPAVERIGIGRLEFQNDGVGLLLWTRLGMIGARCSRKDHGKHECS